MAIKETICIGEAPFLKNMFSQCLKLKASGYRIISFIQAKAGEKTKLEKKFGNTCDELFLEIKTNPKQDPQPVIEALKELLKVIGESTNAEYPESIYIFCLEPTAKNLKALAQEYNIKSIICSKK
jgi:hypothetical protein